MEITEVRVKLVEGGRDKLRAFCSITIDDAFVVRDLKIIDGTKGLFVAMPSRKLTTRCTRCGFKNQVRSNYCNDCGTTLPPDQGSRDGRGKMHADIAHPIHTECRELLQSVVVESYLEEVEASQQPGYRPRDLDDEGGYLESRENEAERVPVLADRAPAEARGERAPSPAADRSDSGRSRPDRSDRDRSRSDRSPSFSGAGAGSGPVRGPITDLDRDPRGSGSRESERRDPEPIFGSDERSASFAPNPGRDRSSAEATSSPPTRSERQSQRNPPSGSARGPGKGSDPRSSTSRKRPLSEMPPPDDNFSAGIF